MREKHEIEEFKSDLSRMDDATVALLSFYFRSPGLAWIKLHALCLQAKTATREPGSAWSRWEFDVPQRQHAKFVKFLSTLINAERERREEAARAAEEARRNSITAEDVESLQDNELRVVRAILAENLSSSADHWRLLGLLGACWPRGMRNPVWRKVARVAEGHAEGREGASQTIEAEVRRRGFDGVTAIGLVGQEDSPAIDVTQGAPRPSRKTSRSKSSRINGTSRRPE